MSQNLLHKPKSLFVFISSFTAFISFGVFIFLLVFNTYQGPDHQETYTSHQVLNAVNLERTKSNLKPLVQNKKLFEAAQSKADEMAEKSYFSHVNPDNGKQWKEFIVGSGYDYIVAGENLANGYVQTENMVEAWMNSVLHKENILNEKVEETGIGISHGILNGRQTIFVVQMFGKRDINTPNPWIKSIK